MNSKSSSSFYTNPLFITVMVIIGIIIILSIFRSVSPALTIGFGVNAHIGDIRGSFELETFDNHSKPEKEALFVMYYAEWCGHCKRTMPEFKKLQDNYKGKIKIIAVNSESEENTGLVKAQNIKGFPTIRYYPSGLDSTFEEYTGGRTYSDFVQYLGGIEGYPDKMPDNAAPF
jgi:thiol-disulfide isomerase/thioredoxin